MPPAAPRLQRRPRSLLPAPSPFRPVTLSPRTLILMTLPPLLWAGNALVGRALVGSVPPLWMNFVRWVLAALLLAPLGWRVLRDRRQIAERWPYLLAIGLLGVGAYNALQYQALVTTTPLNVTLIASGMPVWMLVIGALVYREPTRPAQWLGALLSIGGVLLVIVRGDPARLAQVRLVPGDLYILVATIAFAFYGWLLARPPASMRPPARPGWDWAEMLLLQMGFGLVGAGAAAAGERWLGNAPPPVQWSPGVIAGLAYVAVGPSIIAYRCWGLGVERVGPALAAFFVNMTPLFTALGSAALLGEAPHWYHGVAFVLILGGIVVSSRRPVPVAPAGEPRQNVPG